MFVQHQLFPGLHQRLRQIVSDHVVLGPVLDDVAEHGVKKICGVRREQLHSQQLSDPRKQHGEDVLAYLQHAAGPEQIGRVPPKVRIVVCDRVQRQAECTRADHVRGEVADDLFHLDPAASTRCLVTAVAVLPEFAVQHCHQLLGALLDLAVRATQLAGRERRAELLPHRLPAVSAREEHAPGQQVNGRVDLETVVGEVCKILDGDGGDQRRVADHQVRRAHLVEAAQPGARELPVNAVEQLRLLLQR